MKRFSYFVFVLVTLTVLVSIGCTAKQKPVLRVGISLEYPPYIYKIGDQYGGIDIDIARKIAEMMKMEIKLYPMDFDALFPALASDKIDMAIACISITPERAKKFDFSVPYSVTNQALIAKQDSPLVIEKFQDLGKYIIGSVSGTTGSMYLDENLLDTDLMPKTNLKYYPTDLEVIGELLKGNLDFVIIDEVAAQGFAKQQPIKIAFTINTNEKYGIAMQKGKAINEEINKALDELIKSGEVAAIIQTHTK